MIGSRSLRANADILMVLETLPADLKCKLLDEICVASGMSPEQLQVKARGVSPVMSKFLQGARMGPPGSFVLTNEDRAKLSNLTRTWGPWEFQLCGLTNTVIDYHVPWDELCSTAQIMDWVIHLTGKGGSSSYGGPGMLHFFMDAVRRVLDLLSLREWLLQAPQVYINAPAMASVYNERLKAPTDTAKALPAPPVLLQLAGQYGFTQIRHRRHLLFKHTSGVLVVTPSSPSGRQAIRDTETLFMRVAGVVR